MHLVHDAARGVSEKVPGGHEIQASLLLSDVSPIEQLAQIVLPAAGATDPGAHDEHSVRPSAVEIFPAAHVEQANVPFA